MRISSKKRFASGAFASYAQLAVTRVVHKAKHWQTFACNGLDQSKMSTKSTFVSMIQGYFRVAVAYLSASQRLKNTRRKTAISSINLYEQISS